MAVVSSLRSFDREQQKEYLVPIVIKDSGNPSMTGTSTLTVIIGDSNDNKMQPGSKDILVYNYMVGFMNFNVVKSYNLNIFQGQSPSTEIGRVYVFDKDDWDIADKTFNWKDSKAHPYFSLNSESGFSRVMKSEYFSQFHFFFRNDNDETWSKRGEIFPPV